jgi:hypothetical protein
MKVKTLRRVYLREAAVSLFLARIAVRVIPAARIFAWATRPPRRIRRFAVDETDWVLWAIDNAAAKSRSEALCLPRALAAHSMLRRRGIASRVCLGVAREQGNVIAHAWVEVGGDNNIVANPGTSTLTRLAEFGGPT